MKKSFLFPVIIISALLIPATAALAETSRSQLHFLEEFAVRQYEQGDSINALKEFQRILRIDPNNTLAKEYLTRINANPLTTALSGEQRADRAINDITSLKKDIAEHEKDAKDLEYMIRNLITENDALYQALYKRSREVIELREKFYGTPYGDAYTAAMRGLPIDRVPQRLHPSNDIFPDDPVAATEAAALLKLSAPSKNPVDQQEIDQLIADIALLNKKKVIGDPIYVTRSKGTPDQNKDAPRPAAGKVTVGPPTVIIPVLNEALESKRDAMVEKTMNVIEKKETLVQLQDELLDINTQLKRSGSRYAEALQKIDTYYKRIKEEVAQKNFVEQKMFSDLLADYADRVQEIEELKSSVVHRDRKMTSFKTTLARNNDRIKDADKAMALRDQQLADLKSMLLKYKKALADRNALIETQQKALTLTDNELVGVTSQVKTIEGSLKEGDDQLFQLKDKIARIKQLEDQNERMAASLEESEQWLQKSGAYIKVLERQIALTSTSLKKHLLPSHDKENEALREKIAAIETDLGSKQKEIDATTSGINIMTIREQELLTKITGQEKDIASLKDELSYLKPENARIHEQLAEKQISQERDSQMLRETLAKNEALEKNIAILRQTIQNNAAEAKMQTEKIKSLQETATTLTEEMEQLSIRGVQPARKINYANDKDAISDLEKRLRTALNKLTENETQLTRAASDAAAAKETLAQRDAMIKELKKALIPLEDLRTTTQAIIKTREMELSEVKAALQAKDDKIAHIADEKKVLMAQIERLALTPAPAHPTPTSMHPLTMPPSENPAPVPMNLDQKDDQLNSLRDQLASAGLALKISQDNLKSATEKTALQELKQDTIDRIISERDIRIAHLSADILTLKKEISELNAAQKRLASAKEEAVAAQMISDGKLGSREQEIASLQQKVKALEQGLKENKALTLKKTTAHDATLAELRQANDALEKKAAEVEELQERLDHAATDKVAADKALKNEKTRKVPAMPEPKATDTACGTCPSAAKDTKSSGKGCLLPCANQD